MNRKLINPEIPIKIGPNRKEVTWLFVRFVFPCICIDVKCDMFLVHPREF